MKQQEGVLLLLLAVACGGSANTGSVTGAALSDGQTVAVVKLDDGREVQAVMAADAIGSLVLIGGERVQVEPMPNSKLWRVVRKLDKEKAQNASTTAPFEVTVKSTTKQQQWAPPGGITSLAITKGVSLKLIDGALSGFEAEAGYDIAVVSLEIAMNAPDANLPMDNAVGLDAADKEYGSLVAPAPLGKGQGQVRQFGFAVPVGTPLAALRLSNGYTVKLAGK